MDLYVQPRVGGRKLRLTDGRGDEDLPRWSRDGKLLAYKASRSVRNDSEKEEILSAIFVINPDGGTPRQIGARAYAFALVVMGAVPFSFTTISGRRRTR